MMPLNYSMRPFQRQAIDNQPFPAVPLNFLFPALFCILIFYITTSEHITVVQELEPLLMTCQACGRQLVYVMSEVRGAAEGTLSRRQLSSQQRALNRLLHDPELQRLRRDGPTCLAALEDRAQWLPDSEDVR